MPVFITNGPFMTVWENHKDFHERKYLIARDLPPLFLLRVTKRNDGRFEPLVRYAQGGGLSLAYGDSYFYLAEAQERAISLVGEVMSSMLEDHESGISLI